MRCLLHGNLVPQTLFRVSFMTLTLPVHGTLLSVLEAPPCSCPPAQVKVIEALQQERIAQGGAVDVDIPMPADAWPAWHRAYKRSNFTAEVVSLRLPRWDGHTRIT